MCTIKEQDCQESRLISGNHVTHFLKEADRYNVEFPSSYEGPEWQGNLNVHMASQLRNFCFTHSCFSIEIYK